MSDADRDRAWLAGHPSGIALPFSAIPAVDIPGRLAATGTLAEVLAQAAVEHGPIFRSLVSSGREAGRQVVFMAGPAANRFVLNTHREYFSHAQGWTPVIGAHVGEGLLTMDDPPHAEHRKLWSPAFTAARTETYLPLIDRIIAERTAAWRERGIVDLYEEVRGITFDVAAGALAGLETGAEVDRARDLFYVLFHSFDRRHESWATFQQRRTRARSELDEILLRAIAGRRTISDDPNADVLGMIARARADGRFALTEAQVLGHLKILLVAGHETTTTLGTWALYLLALHAEHRERIRVELASLPHAPGEAAWLRALQTLPWLDCFVREIGRLYSPVLNLPRGTVRPFSFGGYAVSAGTPVRLAIAAGHRLPSIFADPHALDPGRFLPPREEDRRHPYALVTFGAGPRICIGVNVAQIEIKALIAHVLRTYELDPLPDQRPIHAGFWVGRIPFGIRVRVEATTRAM